MTEEYAASRSLHLGTIPRSNANDRLGVLNQQWGYLVRSDRGITLRNQLSSQVVPLSRRHLFMPVAVDRFSCGSIIACAWSTSPINMPVACSLNRFAREAHAQPVLTMKVRQLSYISLAVAALVVLAGRQPIAAQTDVGATTVQPPRSEFETRAALEAQLQLAESQHRTSEAWLIKSRLENGDFQEGDRIVVMLHSTAAKQAAETLTVRAGRVLQLPEMDDLSLVGVLRSELTQRFSQHLAKYLQDSEVRTTPLLRVAVLGSVPRPGYYYVSADLVLNDVIMRAGGPASDADLNGVVVRRGPTVIWDAQDTRTALTDGMSLDRLNLRAGDEVYVAGQHHVPWATIFTITLSLVTLGVTLIRYR
jgi:hypothetical protein